MGIAQTLRITDDSPRCDLERAIASLRAKQDRLPSHFTKRREELAVEIEALMAQWFATPADVDASS